MHRSDKAHQRVDLSQSIQLPSLIGAEERAIIRAIGTQDRFAPVVRAPTGDPGSRTWQPISGCLGDNTRQTQTVITRGAEAQRRANSRLLPCWCPFRIRTRSARVGHHCSNQQGARHCLGLVVGGLRGGPSPSGDIFVAGQNIIIQAAQYCA